MTSVERWAPVVGATGKYSVSDRGRVRSERRVILRSDGRTQTSPARMLSTPPDSQGHPRVVIFYEQGTTGATRTVHQLVLESFIGPRPMGLEILHGNGIHADNRLDNLRYGTSGENKFDSVLHGTHANAAKTHCKRGHAFTPENTYVWAGNGARVCRKCRSLRTSGKADIPIPVTRRTRTPKPRVLSTHCIRGHAYTPDNTYIPPSKPNARECRTCGRDAQRNRRAAKRQTP